MATDGSVGGAAVMQARDLVAALFDAPRHWALVNGDTCVTEAQWDVALEAAHRLRRGMPFAYAVGRASFRNLTLHVDERVLIPRPETELLVELALRHAPAGGMAVDVGTGSGAIAIALATEAAARFDEIVAVDISREALDVARANALRCGAKVRFVSGDLLTALDPSDAPHDAKAARQLNLVVSNPPYIAFDEAAQLPSSVRNWEPTTALLSADNGLDVTRRLVKQASERLAPGGLLALEVDTRRASLVAELVAANPRYTDIAVHVDLTGRERFVLATAI